MKKLERQEMKNLKGGIEDDDTCSIDCDCAGSPYRFRCPESPCSVGNGSITCYGDTHDCNWHCMHR